MFRFIELSLHGWDLWPQVRIPLNREVVLVTGPNGSGKTTLLDAIRQVLNAPKLSSRRRVQNYLRNPGQVVLIRAVVSNSSVDKVGPPFRRERINAGEVTLACALIPGGAGSPEKRFAILPGRATVEQVQKAILESRDSWYPPERYTRALQLAGITRSLMAVLAIEQGQANALFELKPRQLFSRVLELLGDREVLERYQQARRRYEASAREVFNQQTALSSQQVELGRVQREVERLERWERLRDKVRDLEEKVPAAELQELLIQQREVSSKLPELRTKVRNGEAERVHLMRLVQSAKEAEAQARTHMEGANLEEERARHAWGQAKSADGVARERLTRLEELQETVKSMPSGSFADASEELERTIARHAKAEQGLELARLELGQGTSRVDQLRSGRPVYPGEVEETLQVLRKQGFVVTLAANTIDTASSEKAEVSEAVLGASRFALLVAQDDEARVAEIAQRQNFPGPVYAGKTVGKTVKAGALLLMPGAPDWLAEWSDGVSLLDNGMWRDQHGLWVAKPHERVIGKNALLIELKRAEAECETLAVALREAEQAVSVTRSGREQSNLLVGQLRERDRILGETAEVPDARARSDAAASALLLAEGTLNGKIAARENATRKANNQTEDRTRRESDFQQHAARLLGEQEALSRNEEAALRIEDAIREKAGKVREDLKPLAEAGGLEAPSTLLRDLETAQKDFAAEGEPPKSEVREEAKHLLSAVEELEAHVRIRRQEQEAAQAELTECRKRYLTVVDSSLQDYRRRVEHLSHVAEAHIEMELPKLEDDDQILDEAGINVSFGFDGKEAVPLGDPTFSGGQQVIAGLVLLMAMAETDGEGFFILDEPFAHLSLDRVDQVGRFLRGTRSQFIITAPTTLDRAQLDPASLLIVLRKKKPEDQSAPVPIVAEA